MNVALVMPIMTFGGHGFRRLAQLGDKAVEVGSTGGVLLVEQEKELRLAHRGEAWS